MMIEASASVPLVIVGAGGFGRETLDVVEAINLAAATPRFTVLGILDAAPSEKNLSLLSARGVKWLGTESDWITAGASARYLLGIGDPAVRQRVDEHFREAGHRAATAVHPSAMIGSQVTMGAGTVICGGVHVSTNVSLGRHVHLNPNATVGHDSKLDNFVSVNPAATISGDVSIGSGALIGAGAVILQGLRIGPSAIVGASACVVRNVAAGSTVKGVPAR